MRKNEKEGVMQRENERIIYHLMHFNKKDKEWSERPYLLLEDMAIVFDILDLDDRSIQRIDHKKANKEQWSDQFLWESAKKNTKQLLPAKFEPVYKDFPRTYRRQTGIYGVKQNTEIWSSCYLL